MNDAGRKAVEQLAAHDAELIQLRKDVDEFHSKTEAERTEFLAKIEDDYTKLHDEVQKALRAPVHAPQVDVGVPDGLDFKASRQHVLTKAAVSGVGYGGNANVKELSKSDLGRFRVLNDAILTLLGCDPDEGDDAFGDFTKSNPMRWMKRIAKTPMWEEYKSLGRKLMGKAAYDTTSESEWIPTIFSSSLIEPVRDNGMIANLFERVFMPSPAFTYPAITAHGDVYLVSEPTVAPDDSAASKIPTSQETAGNVSLTAVKLAGRRVYTPEMLIGASFDFAAKVVEGLTYRLAVGIDDAILNGDITSTHQDAAVTASTDRRKAWPGLRKIASAASLTTTCSTFSEDDITTSRAAMAQYGGNTGTDAGKNTVMITSWKVHSLMSNFSNIAPVYAYGQAAGVLTGEVGRFQGMPIVPTQLMSDALNTSGVDGSATGLSAAVLVHTPGFMLGELRDLRVRSSDIPYMDTDQLLTVGIWSGDFEPVRTVDSTNPMINYLVSIGS